MKAALAHPCASRHSGILPIAQRNPGINAIAGRFSPHFAALHAGHLWSSRRLKYRIFDQSRFKLSAIHVERTLLNKLLVLNAGVSKRQSISIF